MQKLTKPLSVLLSVIMTLSLLTVVPFSADAYAEEELWELDPDTGELILHPGVYEEPDFSADNDILSVTAENGAVLQGDCSGMFYNCENCTSIDLSQADMTGVTDMKEMFAGCTLCESIDISGAQTAAVTDMSKLFYSCRSLTTLSLGGINTAAVTDMSQMFSGCIALQEIDDCGFDTSSVTDMREMFRHCRELTALDLRGFHTANVNDMSLMFDDCTKLQTLDLSNFDTGSVERMQSMFSSCKALTALELGSFDTNAVRSMSQMFYDSDRLSTIRVGSDWSVRQVVSSDWMFQNCSALTGQNGTVYHADHTNKEYARVDGGTDAPGYLTRSEICRVTWQNYDGTVLGAETLRTGETPSYRGETPEKPTDDANTYLFSGWSPAAGAVSGNTVYTAQFTATKRTYAIKWLNDDGSVLSTGQVAYGDTPVYNGTPQKPDDGDTVFRFSGWEPAVAPVTGEAAYTAVYTPCVVPAWNRLQEQIDNAENGSTITLTKSCVAAGSDPALLIPENKTLTIDLNGFAIDRGLADSEAAENGNVITNKGDLTIKDSSSGQTGVITGGNNTQNGGGIISDALNTLTLESGSVTGNKTGGDGGGVWGNGWVIVKNASVTGNTAAGNGGGICLTNRYGNEVRVSGAPHITGNTKADGTKNNVFLFSQVLIRPTATLSGDAQIGVTSADAEGSVITAGLRGKGSTESFVSDSDAYLVTEGSSGEARLARVYTVIYDANGGTGEMQPFRSADPSAYRQTPKCTFTPPVGTRFKHWQLAGYDDLTYGEEMPVRLNDSIFDYTLTAVWEEIPSVVARHTISLDGDIGVNYYMDLSPCVINSENDPYMLFTVPGTGEEYSTQKVYLNPKQGEDREVAIPTRSKGNPQKQYVFRCRVAAKDMEAEIQAQLVDGTKTTEFAPHSVKMYADYLLENAYTDETHQTVKVQKYADVYDLVQAMLTYGDNAKRYFDEDAAAGAAVTADIPAGFAGYSAENLGEITFERATLSLKSQTTLSLYFNSDAPLTFQCDGHPVDIESKNGKYVIRIGGIAPKRLSDPVTVTVSDGVSTGTVVYRPLTYCYEAANDATSGDKLKNVVKALYRYWVEADRYFR